MISFQRRYQENTKLLTVCKWIADLLIVILLAYTLTLFLCDRTTISGNSMQPAIENEDTVLLNRIAYSFHGPKRYSIIAFHPNGVKTSKIYVKRVIGLPGEPDDSPGYAGFKRAMADFYTEYVQGTMTQMADDMNRQANKKEQTTVQIGNRTITDAVQTQRDANGYSFT